MLFKSNSMPSNLESAIKSLTIDKVFSEICLVKFQIKLLKTCKLFHLEDLRAPESGKSTFGH